LFGLSTQVFTPENIAEHLAAEVFESENSAPARLLDPACGAGHLLIPAAELWLSRASTDSDSDPDSDPDSDSDPGIDTGAGIEQLQTLLSEVITGLDVDRKLLQLCGFAFYLLARDHLAGLRQSPSKTAGKSLDELTDKSLEQSLGQSLGQSSCELPLPRLFLSKSSAGSLKLGLHRNSTQVKAKDADDSGDREDSEDWFDLQGKAAPKLSNTTYNQNCNESALPQHSHHGRYHGKLSSSATILTALAIFTPLSSNWQQDCSAPGGKLSMIVQQSFLSVQRYRAFRLKAARRLPYHLMPHPRLRKLQRPPWRKSQQRHFDFRETGWQQSSKDS
jgi:hypothetical protein